MNDLARPSLYGSYHAIWRVRHIPQRDEITVDVVGPICESGDFLAKDRVLSRFEPGELMAVMSAGAYGHTMSSNYNARPRAPEVMVRGNQVIYSTPKPVPFVNGLEISSGGRGIKTVNNEPVLLQGNYVDGWFFGVEVRGAAVLSKSQIVRNYIGVTAAGSSVVSGNSVSAGIYGIYLTSGASATGNAVFANGLSGISLNGPATATKNNLYGNGDFDPYVKGCGISNNGVVGSNATNNYWGAPSGPGAGTADTVCNYDGGVTRFTPFATKPFTVKVVKP